MTEEISIEDAYCYCTGCCGYGPARSGEVFEDCPHCVKKLGPALMKATRDPFTYALGLRNGTVLLFSEAKILGDWVTLELLDECRPNGYGERGIDVRVSEIAWVADGSS